MYEELIHRIKESNFERPDCTPFDCGVFGLLAEASRALADLRAENAGKDRKIDRLTFFMERARQVAINRGRELERVETERDAAVACIQEAEEAVRFQRLSAVGVAISKWRGAQGGGVSMESKTFSPCPYCDGQDNNCADCELQAYRALGTVEELAALVKARDEGPCGLCRFNPPSSCDGKPCTVCPAEGSSRAEAEAALGGGGDGA